MCLKKKIQLLELNLIPNLDPGPPIFVETSSADETALEEAAVEARAKRVPLVLDRVAIYLFSLLVISARRVSTLLSFTASSVSFVDIPLTCSINLSTLPSVTSWYW